MQKSVVINLMRSIAERKKKESSVGPNNYPSSSCWVAMFFNSFQSIETQIIDVIKPSTLMHRVGIPVSWGNMRRVFFLSHISGAEFQTFFLNVAMGYILFPIPKFPSDPFPYL